MAVVNQYKFAGIDNSTSGAALTPLGASIPAVNETIVIKSILVTSAGTPVVTVINNSITAIKSIALTAGTLVPKGVNALPLVLSSTPTNLYWFTTATILKRNF